MAPRAASVLAGTAAALALAGIAWLLTYDRIYEFAGRTQALQLTVGDEPLLWPVGGAATRCGGAAAGQRSVLEIPRGVTLRITPQRLALAAQERHYWRIEFFAAPAAAGQAAPMLRELHPSEAMASAQVPLPHRVCVDTEGIGAGLVLMLRGRLALGETAGEQPDALPLLEGELSLIESPHARRWHALFDYQFESARTALRMGDRVALPASACPHERQRAAPAPVPGPDAESDKVWGLVRLERGDGSQALPMAVRAHTWADGVCVLRGDRPIGRFVSSPLQSLLSDRVLGWLLSLPFVLWGVSWSLMRWSWDTPAPTA